MNAEQESFLTAIAADPRDHTVLLVYADWLQERGRETEAEACRRLPHRNSPFESLLGRKVLRVWLKSDTTLALSTDAGVLRYEVDADCCSESWFYRVLRADALVGGRVVAVLEGKTDDVDPEDGLGRQESDEVNGYSILTDKGVCEVTFRNSSNGYYGGWLNPSETDHNDWHSEDWLEIASSWQYQPPTEITS